MNKFELMNKVLISDLAPEDKCLLVELILRADEDGQSWPSVERLCKVRGIKHEKNFKGADHYLPGLVTTVRKGRKNHYTLNTPAIEGLSTGAISIKHTPALAVNTPATAGDAPAQKGLYTPAAEGANSSLDNTKDSSMDNARGLRLISTSPNKELEDSVTSSNKETVAVSPNDSTETHTPATEGVMTDEELREKREHFHAMDRARRAGRRASW